MVRVRQRVGKLDAEFPASRARLRVERGDKPHRVGELEIMLEILAPDLDPLPSGLVEDRAGGVEAEQRRVELDEGVEAFLLDEIGAYALDLLRRAAVHSRERERVHGRGGEVGQERASFRKAGCSLGAAAKGIALGKLAQPLRLAVCGGTVSPPIDATLAILGKPESLSRMARALQVWAA